MSVSTVSGTIQDPSGQIFANGTWQLIFKPTPNTPGLFTDGGVPFTTLFGGVLDATGSFSQAGVTRNDTIAPAGSKWTLIVSPNANSQAFSIDLNINNPAFNASALINAIILNIAVPATGIAHAYKDSEVIPVPSSGSLYYDETLKLLKAWDTSSGAWNSFNSASAGVQLSPTGNQVINQLVGTNLSINRFENIRYADQFPGADMAAKIVAAYNDLPATGGCVDATAFEGPQVWGSNPFAGIAFGSAKALYLKLGTVSISCSVQIVIASSNIYVTGRGWQQTSITYTGGGVISSFLKVGTATPTTVQLEEVQLEDLRISGNANVTDALFITGCHYGQFRRLDLRNCTGAGLHTQFAVVNTYDNIQCSVNDGTFSPQPTNGILIDQIDNNHQTTASVVINPRVEGVSGSGIKLSGASGMLFLSGTSEQNNRGIELTAGGVNNRNTFDTMDLEANAVEDVLDNGVATEFRNLVSTGKIHLAGAIPRLVGGMCNSIQVDAGVNNAHIETTWNVSGTGTILDNGSNTYWHLTNPSSGSAQTLIAGTGSFGGGTGTDPTSGWSFRDTTPRKGDGTIGQPDSMSMLRGSYSFVTTGLVLDATPITSAIWRLLFVGSWANNFEGGGLLQPAIIQEVTSANPTITIGTQVVTFSKNGSNQLVGTTTANVIEFVGTIFVCSNIQGLTGAESLRFKGIVTASDFEGTIGATTPSIGNFTISNKLGQADIVADSASITTTETVIVKTAALAANRLIAGTHIRATITGTCTTSVANAPTFTVRLGVNGTTADAAVATAVLAASAASGSNIPFKLMLDFTIRTVGAAATGFVTLELQNQGTTGISPTVQQIIVPSMSTFDTTVAGNIISFTGKTAAGTTSLIFKQAVIEFVYN